MLCPNCFHGLCGNNKLLYQRCVLSHSYKFCGSIVLKLQLKKHVRDHTPCQIWLSSGANTQFVTTLVLPFVVFTARCYAERGYATVYCLSVCPSVCLSIRDVYVP